jgi:hypothetical protein
LPAVTSLVFPAGSVAGATQTLTLTLLNNFTVDATHTIELGLRPIDSFAAVDDSTDVMTVRIIDDGEPLQLVDDLVPASTGSLFGLRLALS